MTTRCIAVVGMNGAGKTVFGKRLASKLGWKRTDTDRVFEEQSGDHHAFIERHGWEEFRQKEEQIVLDALQPGYVVTLSGGAIESPAVRAALKDRAVVLWLQADAQRIKRHLDRARVERPEFKDGIDHAAVETMLTARNPHYEAVADIRIPATIPFAQQVPVAMLELQKYDPTTDPRR